LAEVEDFLKQTKGKWKLMVIIVYANSFYAEDESVQQLRQLASKYSLNTITPQEYFSIEKGAKKTGK